MRHVAAIVSDGPVEKNTNKSPKAVRVSAGLSKEVDEKNYSRKLKSRNTNICGKGVMSPHAKSHMHT
jgi:ribosomal protein L28